MISKISDLLEYFSVMRDKEEMRYFSYVHKINDLTNGILAKFSIKKRKAITTFQKKIKESEQKQLYLTSFLLSLNLIRSLSKEIEEELSFSTNNVYLNEKDYIDLKRTMLSYQKMLREIEEISFEGKENNLDQYQNIFDNWTSKLLEILDHLKNPYQNNLVVPVDFFSIPIDLSILSMNKKELWLFSILNGYNYETYNQLYYFYEFLKKEGYFISHETYLEDKRARKK